MRLASIVLESKHREWLQRKKQRDKSSISKIFRQIIDQKLAKRDRSHWGQEKEQM